MELKDVRSDLRDVRSELTDVRSELTDVSSELTGVRTDLSDVRTDLNHVSSNLTDIKTEIKSDIQSVRSDLEEKFQGLSQQITSFELTLENETNQNIMFIAEGHLDLSRKFDEALNYSKENEIMKIKITSIENQLRRIKEKLSVS